MKENFSMKCDIFFKLFTILFSTILFVSPIFAEVSDSNILSKIIVEQAENNSYRLNLLFNQKFTGNAFIQKGESGNYYVYIPETIIQSNKIKIAYKNRKDKSNIKISIEEKPFIKEDMQSNYVRISVNMKDDYSLRLLAKTSEQEKNVFSATPISFNSFIFIVLLAIVIYLFFKMIKMTKSTYRTSYTAFPTGYSLPIKDHENNNEYDLQTIKPTTLPKLNIKKTLKSIDNNSFSCFDIPLVDDTKPTQDEFKSTLKQTSNLLKEKSAKSKLTNPISNNFIEDSSELALPVIEKIKKKEEKAEEKNTTPELLSELHITPTKGFYLTTVDDSFALFGYVGEKVFLLQKFNDLTQINLQARFYDRSANKDMYIVRLDSYKALVEISDEGMKELAVL